MSKTVILSKDKINTTLSQNQLGNTQTQNTPLIEAILKQN